MTDDFSDNDEQVTIDEDSGEKTGNVIDGVSVDGPVTCRASASRVRQVHLCGSGIHHCRCGSFSLAANGRTASPGGQLQRRGAGGHYVLTDAAAPTVDLSISVTR
ncbi:hypothetical protein FKF78_11805 [Aeromonas hydrophila]|nr:hypothetical protein [Aeromonas hydrophila]